MSAPGTCMNILNARSNTKDVGTVTNPERFLDQDFQTLKQYCQHHGLRYIDDMFPPDRRSIGSGILDPSVMARVVWMRPRVGVHTHAQTHKHTHTQWWSIFGQHYLCCRNYIPTPVLLPMGRRGLILAKEHWVRKPGAWLHRPCRITLHKPALLLQLHFLWSPAWIWGFVQI